MPGSGTIQGPIVRNPVSGFWPIQAFSGRERAGVALGAAPDDRALAVKGDVEEVPGQACVDVRLPGRVLLEVREAALLENVGRPLVGAEAPVAECLRLEKERIVAAAMEPGAVASEVARAAGIHTSQLFRWRQQLCERAQIPAAFNPVAVTPEPGAISPPPAERAGVIEIELASGGRMRVTGPVRCSDGGGADEGIGQEQASKRRR